MKKMISFCFLFVSLNAHAQSGRVGINVSAPAAMLHVKDSSVVFTGTGSLPVVPGNPPVSGSGSRMMWYPDQAAFRVGRVFSTNWDYAEIGTYSFAAGVNPKASGISSIALGNGSQATGPNSLATGGSTHAIGNYSTAMGNATYAIGDFSTALGYSTHTTGTYSTSLGFITSARAYASLTIGRYNDTIISSSPTSWVAADPVFIIGNGTAPSSLSNALTILKNAKTGINMSLPVAGLDIKGVDATDNRHIRLEDNNTTSSGNIFYSGDMFFKNNQLNGNFYFRNSVNANAMSLFSSGNVTIAGILTQSSDARLKKNIYPLKNSLQKIISLKGYNYEWKEGFHDRNIQSGLLAQEVEERIPELVITGTDDMKSINYNGLIPYLIEAIKELKEENIQMKKEIDKLKADKL